MAGSGWSWTKLLAAELMIGAGLLLFAQSAEAQSVQTGSLTGKLTDLHSAPLGGIALILRNQATGAEARTTTAKNGSYHFDGLNPGSYTVAAESEQLGRGRVEDIMVAAGHEARVQTAMQFKLPSPWPIRIFVHDIPTVNPETATAALAEEPLRSLPLGRLARSLFTPPPLETVAPVLMAGLAARPIPLRGLIGLPAREPLRRVVPEVETVWYPVQLLASVPLPSAQKSAAFTASIGLAVPAHSGAGNEAPAPGAIGSVIWVGGNGDAAMVDAVTRTVQAAMQILKPGRKTMPAAAPTVDPASVVTSTTVSAAELQALPAAGRRWQDFELDTPTAATQGGGASPTSLRGAGQQQAETTVDGASTRLAFGNVANSGPSSETSTEQRNIGMSRGGNRGLAVAEAAIRQVQTEAGNVEAEGRRAAGGRVNVETTGGGNGLHGQGFLFDRQNNWGAQNPFTQWVKQTAPAALTGLLPTVPVFDNGPSGPRESYTPPDHETTWGIGLGSQIRRDKLFWFAALDSYNRNDPGLAMVKHPYLSPAVCDTPPCSPTGFFAQPTNCQMQTLSARLGVTIPGLSQGCVSALIPGLTAYSGMLEKLAGLLGPAPRTATQWVGFARIDWQAAERHRLTLEAIGADWNSPGGGLTRLSENYGNHSFGTSRASEEWLLGRWEAYLTPNLLAITQASAGHTVQQVRPSTPSPFEQTFLSGNAWGQLPQIVVDNRYGFTIGNPSRFGQGNYPDERAYQGQETLDWVRGNLLVKAGAEFGHNFDATSLLRNQTGTYTYSNVENFASDALVFGQYGLSGVLNPASPHGCDQTGTVWTDTVGKIRGLGSLPCYSYYSQMIGPSNWHLSTNDWAGFVTTQWQPHKVFVISAGLRWEREQLPPPISALANSDLRFTQKLPNLGNNWGPRISLAVGSGEARKRAWPVLRLGYGMYFGRTENGAVLTALTQTGSPHGDQSFFIRPTDGFSLFTGKSDAPLFPSVLTGPPAREVKPGAVAFAPNFHNSEVQQAVVAIEQHLPGHVELTGSALVSLGRRLPISIDTNLDSPTSRQTITYAVIDGTKAGPIKTPTITVPFYAAWPSGADPCPYYQPANTGLQGRPCPDYQQITSIMSRANSTYEAAVLRITRYGSRGLSLHAHYTYAHAMDWNPNESTAVAGSDVLDPADFKQEYGTSNLDVRHSAAAMVIYEAPWKLRAMAGRFANGWMLSGIAQFRSGLPYTMRTSGSLAREVDQTTGATILALGPGMNGSGGDNRVYGIGRNTYRYPGTWKADLRLGKRFDLGHERKLELMGETFNLFNHQNVTELETTGYYIESGGESSLPTLNFLTGPVVQASGKTQKVNTTEFGQPLNINATNFYRERQFQLGVRMRF